MIKKYTIADYLLAEYNRTGSAADNSYRAQFVTNFCFQKLPTAEQITQYVCKTKKI